MTEAEWLECGDTLPMLELLLTMKTTSRKLRLFACTWFRDSRWSSVAEIVEIGERYADGVALRGEIEQARRSAGRSGGKQAAWVTVCDDVAYSMRPVLSHEFADLRGNVNILRDIFGNPFHAVTFAPEWRTETAVTLAQTMYDARDFGNLPILADALQDAGCEKADVLEHCRGPGPHVRGC